MRWFSSALKALLSGRFFSGLTGPGDGLVGITPSNALILFFMDGASFSFSSFSDLKCRNKTLNIAIV